MNTSVSPRRYFADGILCRFLIALTLMLAATMCWTGARADVAIDSAHFPDAQFRAVLSEFDSDGNGALSDDEVANVTWINCAARSIQSLTGLDVFVNLQGLNCASNLLETLDVSGNPALWELACGDNLLTTLDLTQNPTLARVNCEKNLLESLKVPKDSLMELYCTSNKLTELDISSCGELVNLYCSSNLLEKLDVAQCPKLENLNCDNNLLAELDVTGNTQLKELYCGSNMLTRLDVTKNTLLGTLNCAFNQLEILDVSSCIGLSSLHCNNNRLEKLDVSGNTRLSNFWCSENRLVGLDLSANRKLEGLSANDNYREISLTDGQFDLSTLNGFDLSKASDWSGCTVSGNMLTADIHSEVMVITYEYDCGSNQRVYFKLLPVYPVVVKIDEAHFPDERFRAVVAEIADQNHDSQLDAREIAITEELYCKGIEIHSFTGIENFTDLKVLNCGDNPIEVLDVSSNTNLTKLWCNNNQLKALDVTKNTALTLFACSDNQLTSLDVTHNPLLTELKCDHNRLSMLDVSHNLELTFLDLNGNCIAALDVSENKALTTLNCFINDSIKVNLSNGIVDLMALPGLDTTRMRDVKGGLVSDGRLVPGLDSEEITYTYDCSRNFTINCTLKLPPRQDQRVFTLPKELERVEAQAFSDVDCRIFLLPGNIRFIAENAFPQDALLYYPVGSETEKYCKENAAALPVCLPRA